MRGQQLTRALKLLAPGLILLQATSCSLLNEYLQTVLLGVTAAGSIAILQNL